MFISSEERHLYRLKYVLAIYLVQQVIAANEQSSEAERSFVREYFPPALLKALDLCDSEKMSELLEEALQILPQRLTLTGKLDIIGMCFAASTANGDVDIREIATIQAAAEVLQLPNEILFDYIRQLLED